MSFSVQVDVSNPGQFFACCGLFELAGRRNSSARAWFSADMFVVDAADPLEELLIALARSHVTNVPGDDDKSCPLVIEGGVSLRLDWWKDEASGGSRLKTWAGQQRVGEIARAMHSCFEEERFRREGLFLEPSQPVSKSGKVEPFYFDSRRSENSHSREVGFSADALGLTTTTYPAVELLALLGLQRCRPVEIERRWFRYHPWAERLPVPLACAAVTGVVARRSSRTLKFQNWPRSGYFKAFRRASPLAAQGD